jgi:hypothetical protein
VVRWRGHANLLFTTWLNYYVYQETPFDLQQLRPGPVWRTSTGDEEPRAAAGGER